MKFKIPNQVVPMTKTKHTPGPKSETYYAPLHRTIRYQEGGVEIARVTLSGHIVGREFSPDQWGNLIAAAPELLEAAKAAQDHACSAFECGEDRNACPIRGYLRAVIAKAEWK